MRKLLSTTFITLDGVMQAPGGPEEDTSLGFEYGGWSAPLWDQESNAFMADTMGHEYDLLLGRKTWDIFAAYWPKHPEIEEVATQFNKCNKYVASKGSVDTSRWENSHQLQGDVVAAVKALKATDGPELQVHGSGDFLQTLMTNNLLDEMRVITYPVLLGKGKKLFAEGTIPNALKYVSGLITSAGVAMAIYQPTGDEPKTGTMG